MSLLTRILTVTGIIAVTGGILLLGDCRKTESGVPAVGYQYYPLRVGDTLYYQEDSILYNDFFSTVDTAAHQVMDVTVSVFTDNSGRDSYLVDRFIRDSSSEPWQEDFTYSVTPQPNRIEDLENNLRFIKLIFPVRLKASWPGNSFIDPDPSDNLSYLEGWNYQYVAVNTPDTVAGNRFDSTLTVVQQPDLLIQTPSYGSELYSIEKYASGVGLIYKHFIYWQQQCIQYDQSGNCLQLGARGGYEVILQLTGHN